jgi:hypothetical protein
MTVVLPPNNTDVPESYVGAWRKRSERERSYWLQTHRLHAMIDIPADRPDFAGRRGWEDFSDAELMILAQQGGVAGACIAAEDILHRRRQVDYLPQRGQPFLRRLRREGNLLTDVSLNGQHPWVWECLADGSQMLVGLRFHDVEMGGAGDQCRGYLLVVGPYFMYVRDRFVATQRAESLALLAELKGFSRSQLVDVLDFELSFGRREKDEPWRIELSTIPFREGRQLMTDEVLQRIIAQAGRGPERIRRAGRVFLRYWTLDEGP